MFRKGEVDVKIQKIRTSWYDKIIHNTLWNDLINDNHYRSSQDDDAYLRFPERFAVGAGGSAYQTEGGWNASGNYAHPKSLMSLECGFSYHQFWLEKGESILDRLTHTQPWKFRNGSNGDTACDSYHKYKEDVQWVKKMKVSFPSGRCSDH